MSNYNEFKEEKREMFSKFFSEDLFFFVDQESLEKAMKELKLDPSDESNYNKVEIVDFGSLNTIGLEESNESNQNKSDLLDMTNKEGPKSLLGLCLKGNFKKFEEEFSLYTVKFLKRIEESLLKIEEGSVKIEDSFIFDALYSELDNYQYNPDKDLEEIYKALLLNEEIINNETFKSVLEKAIEIYETNVVM